MRMLAKRVSLLTCSMLLVVPLTAFAQGSIASVVKDASGAVLPGVILRFGRTTTSVNFDVYNVFNANTVLTLNNAFSTWQRPTSILLARFAKISAQIDF